MYKVGILMIHGTFGSPKEFTAVESVLRSQGYLTQAISLPGHGDHPESTLKEVTGQSMLSHCLQEYMQLAARCDAVFLLGHSLGGVLSLLLAANKPEKLSGVISFGTPYERAYFVNYLHGFLKFPVENILPGLRYAPEYLTGYKSPAFSPWWFPQLYKEATWLLIGLQQTLPMIDVPVQLAHSPHDMIVPFNEMKKIATRIGQQERVHMHVFQSCGHQVFPNSREAEAGMKLIINFMSKYGVSPNNEVINAQAFV